MSETPFILTLSCADTVGIVAAVSGFLAQRGGFIVESQQFADRAAGRFFLRVAFIPAQGAVLEADALRAGFADIATGFGMDWSLADSAVRPRILIAVSRFGHCLNDLLHRWRTGSLPVEIAGVVSNHDDLRSLVEWHGLPWHHIPVTPATKPAGEAALLDLMAAERVDLLVLARYMQVLSPELSAALAWRCINIHHSFLPSFKGAAPYTQAWQRGVKLIGATAHYVTGDLDEGPIIEQGSTRVDHSHTAEDMVRIGRDVEAQVLAHAVTWAAEQRILPNGRKTVVFRR